MRKAQDKGLTFGQPRSNAIVLHDIVPADSIERVVNTKTRDILYQEASLSPRPPPEITLKEAWQVQRDDSHQRGTSTGNPVADEEKKELKIDLRVQRIPQTAVDQDEDRKRGIKILAHMIKLQSKAKAPTRDLQKTDTFNPFSEESKKGRKSSTAWATWSTSNHVKFL